MSKLVSVVVNAVDQASKGLWPAFSMPELSALVQLLDWRACS